MNKTFIKIYFILGFVLFFQACSFKDSSLQSIAQTNSASLIRYYKNDILKQLILYKRKLDLRNPTSYNKKIASNIYHQITRNEDYINIIEDNKKLKNYNQYLYYAFLDEDVRNRNDFLILGIYKLLYKAYKLEDTHKFTALQYDSDLLQKLYTYLQVIRWKIRTKKDRDGNYLFLTWQNNWQIELKKKKEKNLNIINDLHYIKTKKESIYSPSNLSFEVLISLMLLNIKHTLKNVNIEPVDLSVSALKSFVFIL